MIEKGFEKNLHQCVGLTNPTWIGSRIKHLKRNKEKGQFKTKSKKDKRKEKNTKPFLIIDILSFHEVHTHIYLSLNITHFYQTKIIKIKNPFLPRTQNECASVKQYKLRLSVPPVKHTKSIAFFIVISQSFKPDDLVRCRSAYSGKVFLITSSIHFRYSIFSYFHSSSGLLSGWIWALFWVFS